MTPFEIAYNEVAELVQKFDEHRDQFMAPKYQEAHVRAEFLDKFWTALGWDVRHEFQTNPREQEVKIEKSDNVSMRKADYAFYLKPEYQRPVFLVEAKKPSQDIEKPEYYFQTARYGFNTGTSVAVLTDFQEFHIIDCRRKPELVAGIVNATQLFKFSYKDYLDRDKFGEIYWKFSREAVAEGKLKEYWRSLKKPKGAVKQLKLIGDQLQAPDDLFLDDLEEYRRTLASEFKKSNENMTSEDLTQAAQKVLDRLVFIRFLEDKMIEPDAIIDKFTSASKTPSWKTFIVQSQKLDKTYNGVVFKEHFIDRSSFNAPKDEKFAAIADELSHHRSPYLFSYIPVEILGSIYERFLGKVVVAKGRGIAVEEKPEVRKAGGVYYTPKYIVDYIVSNTVGKILDPCVGRRLRPDTPVNATIGGDATGRAGGADLRDEEGLTPDEISKLRFADIACGSGSFLIAIFDAINNYLEKWYTDHPDEAVSAGCREMQTDDNGRLQYGLSLEQKRSILQSNIFGVDIDSQAVEVAQFSLFLKLLESETIASVQGFISTAATGKKVSSKQLTFHHGVDRKVLPDLSKNIQCGNSLVEYDISDLFPLTDEEEKRIKPFSFQTAFREIMANGGFDAIVGNPPYGMVTEDNLKEYFHNRYFSAEGRYDRFELFIERSLKLIKQNGFFSYIVPTPILSNLYSRRSRRFIYDHSRIAEIVNFGIPVFKDPTVHSCILILENGKPDFGYEVSIKKQVLSQEGLADPPDFTLSSDSITPHNGHAIDIFVSPAHASIITKMQNGADELGNTCFIRQCIKTGDDSQYVRNSSARPAKDWKPSLRGRSIERYYTSEHDLYLKYGEWLARNWKNKSFYETPKIALRETGSRITATLDLENRYFLSSLYAVYFKGNNEPDRLKVLLAILNSKLCNFFVQLIAFSLTEGAFTKIRTNQLARFPLREINPKSEKIQKSLISHVDRMFAAKKQLADARRDSDREQYQRKCEFLDDETDKLVYALYGLTAEEIKIVESS